MHDDVNPALGISRRNLMKRGAVVGGGLVWATPVVQTVNRRAMAQADGTPPPDGRIEGGAISFVALVLDCPDGYARVKYNVDEDDAGSWETQPGRNGVPQCPDPAGWDAATDADGAVLGITVSGGNQQGRVCFDLSATACTFVAGVTKGKAGVLPPGSRDGFCETEDPAHDTTVVCFSDPTL